MNKTDESIYLSLSLSLSLACTRDVEIKIQVSGRESGPFCYVLLRARRTSAFGGPKITENGSPSESTSQRMGAPSTVNFDKYRGPGSQKHSRNRHQGCCTSSADISRFLDTHPITSLSQTTASRSCAPTFRSIRFKSGNLSGCSGALCLWPPPKQNSERYRGITAYCRFDRTAKRRRQIDE